MSGVTRYSLVGSCPSITGTCFVCLGETFSEMAVSLCRGRVHYVSYKRRNICTRLHGVTSKKIVIFMIINLWVPYKMGNFLTS
jgi:hypothetical protein